jgi:hypothetical protein
MSSDFNLVELKFPAKGFCISGDEGVHASVIRNKDLAILRNRDICIHTSDTNGSRIVDEREMSF